MCGRSLDPIGPRSPFETHTRYNTPDVSARTARPQCPTYGEGVGAGVPGEEAGVDTDQIRGLAIDFSVQIRLYASSERDRGGLSPEFKLVFARPTRVGDSFGFRGGHAVRAIHQYSQTSDQKCYQCSRLDWGNFEIVFLLGSDSAGWRDWTLTELHRRQPGQRQPSRRSDGSVTRAWNA